MAFLKSEKIPHLAQRLITDEVLSAVETILVKHLLFAKERHDQFLLGLIPNGQEGASEGHLREVSAICAEIHRQIKLLDCDLGLADQNFFTHPTFDSAVVGHILTSAK